MVQRRAGGGVAVYLALREGGPAVVLVQAEYVVDTVGEGGQEEVQAGGGRGRGAPEEGAIDGRDRGAHLNCWRAGGVRRESTLKRGAGVRPTEAGGGQGWGCRNTAGVGTPPRAARPTGCAATIPPSGDRIGDPMGGRSHGREIPRAGDPKGGRSHGREIPWAGDPMGGRPHGDRIGGRLFQPSRGAA
eukprot:scaffold19606_cov84-Isochrysis_galbana.AAC.2